MFAYSSGSNTPTGNSDGLEIHGTSATDRITAAGTLTIDTAQSPVVLNCADTTGINNLRVNSGSGRIVRLGNATTIGGSLIIAAGTVDTDSSNNYALTVNNDETDVQAAGTLTGNASAISLKALTIRDGGTYNGTSGTTTITGEQGGYAWSNQETDGTGFVHNNGTVTITTPTTTVILERDSFYNLIINNGDNITQWDASLTCAGTLLVNAGDTFYADDAGNTLTVTGAVTVNGVLGTSGRTGAYSFGSLTIAVGGTYNATAGTTTINGTFDNNGTDPTTSFIHNNGTVLIEPQAAAGIAIKGSNTGTGTVFYNVTTGASSNSNIVELVEKMVILNHLDANVKTRPSGEVRFGKADASTAAEGGSVNTGTSFQIFGGTLIGLSTIYPTVFTGGINYESSSAMRLSNLDWSAFSYTVGNNPTITLDGDMIFGALTINAGTTLDINGQRMECSGIFTIADGGDVDETGGGLLVLHNNLNILGAINGSNGLNVIVDGGTAHKWNLGQSGGGAHWADVVMTNGTVTHNGGVLGNPGGAHTPRSIIIGNGTFTQSGGNTNLLDITVATGGTFVPSPTDTIVTCERDFTTSGGLIGKSALNANDTHAAYGTATSYASSNMQSLTMSGWVKMNSDFSSQETNQAVMRQNDTLLMVRSGGEIYAGVELSKADNVTFSYPDCFSAAGLVTASKWHHIALTWKASEGLKVYLDGKLVGERNDATTGGDFTHLRRRDGTSSVVGGRDNGSNINSQLAGTVAQAARWQHTDTSAAKSAAQIRTEMFQKASELSSTTGLYLWFQFDNGTGTTAIDSSPNTTNFTVGTIAKSAEASWVGAGTFTQGTSTVDLTGTGTLTYQGEIDFNILKTAAATKTTTVQRLSSGDININTNLYKGAGTLTTGSSIGWRLSRKTGVGDVNNSGLVVSGASYPVDLSSSYIVYYHDATIAKEVKWQYFINGSDTTFAANQEATGYWHNAAFQTDVGDYNLKCTYMRYSDAEAGKFTMGSGDLWLTTNGSGVQTTYPSNTFTVGPGATVSGSTAGTNFKSQNNFSVVGSIKNFDVVNEELKVTGQVINCTGDIHQYFPTIDHAQQLDADTADDRDVRLGRDLDKNTELINS